MGHGFVTDGNTLYTTQDGGQTWQETTPNVGLKGTSQLDFVSDQVGWAVCSGRLLRTDDGGRTWRALSP